MERLMRDPARRVTITCSPGCLILVAVALFIALKLLGVL
jgi:hypothetical protein